MAYLEVRKGKRLISRRTVDEDRAMKGLRVRLGSEGQTRIRLGESKTIGSYRVDLVTDETPPSATTTSPAPPASAETRGLSELQFSGAPRSGRTPASQAVPEIDGYVVLDELGHGGMGIVWRAVQLSTKRHVALKLLGIRSFASKRARARFGREVALAARLTHPNIARIYDSGLRSGIYYYAMELVEGLHLDRYAWEMGLDHDRILALMKKVCEAMAFAHSKGVVHRDLKPSNILVTGDGEPHILDFGLAKASEKARVDLTISIEGEVAGTPGYMSPEQAAGDMEAIDERSDVYSLGVILYQLLTGKMPHDMSGSPYQVMKRKVEEDVIPPRRAAATIGRDLECLLLKALARDPRERYRSAADFAEDIGHYLASEPLSAKKGDSFYLLRKCLRKHRRYAVTVVVALIATAVAGVALDYFLREFQSMEEEIVRTSAEDRRRIDMLYEQRRQRRSQFQNRRENEAQAAYLSLARAMQNRDWNAATQELNKLKNQCSDTNSYRNHQQEIEVWDRQLQAMGFQRFAPQGYQYLPRGSRR